MKLIEYNDICKYRKFYSETWEDRNEFETFKGRNLLDGIFDNWIEYITWRLIYGKERPKYKRFPDVFNRLEYLCNLILSD